MAPEPSARDAAAAQLKATRRALRARITKAVDEVLSFETDSRLIPDLFILNIKHSKLVEHITNLKQSDASIMALIIDESDIELEAESAAEYAYKAMYAKYSLAGHIQQKSSFQLQPNSAQLNQKLATT